MFTDSESGEIICRNCGMVMLDNVQESRPEWRSFTTDEVNNSRSRTGMPTSLARHDKGLATKLAVIHYDNRSITIKRYLSVDDSSNN